MENLKQKLTEVGVGVALAILIAYLMAHTFFTKKRSLDLPRFETSNS